MNVSQALSSEKRFLSPRCGSNPQPSDDRCDALTTELPRLRWWAKVQVQNMCDPSGYILEVWELGDILRWQMNIYQALSSEKRFLSPRQGSNPQPSDDQWDALIIELPRLKWWAKVQVWHMYYLWATYSSLHLGHTYVELAP